MKKVLIVTYYWPPAGGPGIQRILKFTRYLPDFGWQPIVLTVEHPSSPANDQSLSNKINPQCIVYKTGVIEPFNLYKTFTGKAKSENIPKDIIVKKGNDPIKEKIARWVRANLFVPDARIGWVPYIVKEGMKIIQHEKPDVIFSTSPPHSLQLGAKRLAKKSNLKWIADFRDPWSEAYWESEIGKSALTQKINTHFEKQSLMHANTVTSVSKGVCDLLEKKIKNEYVVLYNGFDDINREQKVTDRFNIFFIGNLSKYQDPDPFIKALKMLPKNVREKIDIYFIGKVFDDYKDLFLQESFILKNYMPYSEMMEFSKSACIFLLILHQTSYTLSYMTAKIFDYLALRKPILAIGKKKSTVERVLKETQSGTLFENNEINEITEFLISYYTEWQKNKFLLLDENENLMKYSTQSNVEKLAGIFNKLS